MVWLTALFVGLVQGLCRFLPISVSGHMSILVNLFGLGYAKENHAIFEALMHLAACGAIMSIYGREFIGIVRETINYSKMPVRDRNTERLPQNVRIAAMVGVACIPFIVPMFCNGLLNTLYNKTAFSGAAMIITGVILWATFQIQEGKRTAKSMSVGNAVLIGLGAAVSCMPGMSIFATVYALCVTSDFRQTNAVRFTYMIMAPIYLLAGVFGVLGALNSGVDWTLIWMYLVSALVTYIVSYISILFFRYIAERKKLINVSLYMLAIGMVTLVLSIFM